MGQYKSARRVTSLSIFVGWLFAFLGGIATALALSFELVALTTHVIPVFPLGVGFPIAIAACIAGLFLVLCSLMARAVFDVAETLQATR